MFLESARFDPFSLNSGSDPFGLKYRKYAQPAGFDPFSLNILRHALTKRVKGSDAPQDHRFRFLSMVQNHCQNVPKTLRLRHILMI